MNRATIGRLAGVVAILAIVVVGLHVLGVGGYRFAPAMVFTILVAGGGTAAAVVLRDHPARWTWTAVVAVVALIAGGILVDRAVLSRGRLIDEMDALELPFFEVASEQAAGHSTCRPSCPRIERTYRGPNIATRAAMLQFAGALARDGVIPVSLLAEIGNDRTFEATGARYAVRLEVGEVVDQARLVTLVYRAIRPTG